MTLLQRDPILEEFRMPMRMRDLLSHWPSLWTETPWGDAELLRVEECREGDTLTVRAEIPGIDPDRDVTVSIEDGVLTIHGERRQAERSKTSDGFRSEFRYGAFTRSVVLPAGTPTEAIAAEYHDGILEVKVPLPVMTAPSPTRIPVQRA